MANAAHEVAAGIRAGVGAGSRVRPASTTCSHWDTSQRTGCFSLTARPGREPEVEVALV